MPPRRRRSGISGTLSKTEGFPTTRSTGSPVGSASVYQHWPAATTPVGQSNRETGRYPHPGGSVDQPSDGFRDPPHLSAYGRGWSWWRYRGGVRQDLRCVLERRASRRDRFRTDSLGSYQVEHLQDHRPDAAEPSIHTRSRVRREAAAFPHPTTAGISPLLPQRCVLQPRDGGQICDVDLLLGGVDPATGGIPGQLDAEPLRFRGSTARLRATAA